MNLARCEKAPRTALHHSVTAGTWRLLWSDSCRRKEVTRWRARGCTYARACCGESDFQLLHVPEADDAWSTSTRWLTGFSTTPLFEPRSAKGLELEAAAELINFGAVELGDLCVRAARGGGPVWRSAPEAANAGWVRPSRLGALAWDRVIRDAVNAGAKPILRRWARLQLEQLSGGERGIGELLAKEVQKEECSSPPPIPSCSSDENITMGDMLREDQEARRERRREEEEEEEPWLHACEVESSDAWNSGDAEMEEEMLGGTPQQASPFWRVECDGDGIPAFSRAHFVAFPIAEHHAAAVLPAVFVVEADSATVESSTAAFAAPPAADDPTVAAAAVAAAADPTSTSFIAATSVSAFSAAASDTATAAATMPPCLLLYTSDAADDTPCLALRRCRHLKKTR